MPNVGLIFYVRALKIFKELLDYSVKTIGDSGEPVDYIDKLNRSLNVLLLHVEAQGVNGLNKIIFNELYNDKSRPEPNPEVLEARRSKMSERGRLGGGTSTRRKRAASKKNGLKGGRPSPDIKTKFYAMRLAEEIKWRKNYKSWEAVANYSLPPRFLRCVKAIMLARGLDNQAMGLPEKWDPDPGSKDPHKRYADFARRQGYWLKSHPPRACPW